VADLVAEVHDTHHPIAVSLTYEQQRREAHRRSRRFVAERIPRYRWAAARVLAASGGRSLLGPDFSYVDLSLFQVVEGLRYAFPRAMRRIEPRIRRVTAVADAVRERPRIAAYLASPRRLPFSTEGIFRHYPELETVRLSPPSPGGRRRKRAGARRR
jgi:glutathione S-transferase